MRTGGRNKTGKLSTSKMRLSYPKRAHACVNFLFVKRRHALVRVSRNALTCMSRNVAHVNPEINIMVFRVGDGGDPTDPRDLRKTLNPKSPKTPKTSKKHCAAEKDF